jgi:hypothetical protein
MHLVVGHISGEVYDALPLRRSDYEKVFSQGVDILTGTEVAQPEIKKVVREVGDKHGFSVFTTKNNAEGFIAFRRELFPGKMHGGHIPVLESAKAAGDPHPYTAKGITFAWKESPVLGRVHAATFHMLTNGRWPGQAQQDHPGDPVNHFKANQKYGEALAKWASEAGTGPDISFVNGDTNLLDNRTNVFHDKRLVTVWDELDKHPNTGHGNIDVIASLKSDGRVKAVSARVFDDRELHLNSDHFFIKAVYNVEPVKS